MENTFKYQESAAEEVLKNALSKQYVASVLAACPGSGKTTISHIIINNFLKMFPNSKIVVLTEGQNTLKNQYLSELDQPNVPISFTYGSFGSGAQVEVGIPQSINKLTSGEVDLFIFDEAHNYFLAPIVQNIVFKLNPKYKILMTGSPTKYNKHNQEAIYSDQKEYAIHHISAEELINSGVFSSVTLDVCSVVNKLNPSECITKAFVLAKNKGYNLDKVMVACPTIEFAKGVYESMLRMGRKVSMSTSENDKENKEIDKFKKGETDSLIVVGKGILGFNDKNITSLFDLRSSTNVDSAYQLFARVLRVHPNGVEKSYVRVAETNNVKKESLFLRKIVSLMERSVFTRFNGKNLKPSYY